MYVYCQTDMGLNMIINVTSGHFNLTILTSSSLFTFSFVGEMCIASLVGTDIVSQVHYDRQCTKFAHFI